MVSNRASRSRLEMAEERRAAAEDGKVKMENGGKAARGEMEAGVCTEQASRL